MHDQEKQTIETINRHYPNASDDAKLMALSFLLAADKIAASSYETDRLLSIITNKAEAI